MALKWLPHRDDWDTFLGAHKLDSDNGLGKALEVFWAFNTDEFDKRLAALPRLLKLATELKKSKDVVAAGASAVKWLTEVIDVIPKVRRQVEQEKKRFESSGAHPIDVQFIVVDWNGRPLDGGNGSAVFRSPGVPHITRRDKMSGNGLDIDDVRLRPSGTVNLTIFPGSGDTIEGTTDYEFKPGKAVMKFKAVQHSRQYKTRAKSIDEVSSKLGFKGKVGVEWEVVKIGGEVSTEAASRHALEDEVEWQLQAGLPTFLEFKQI